MKIRLKMIIYQERLLGMIVKKLKKILLTQWSRQ
ncbi:MAG TPA: hypothetical protein [Caudoviricetes sp.]|nr:MAG TPA: hypothetical protein [Caudoviricetes sp.]